MRGYLALNVDIFGNRKMLQVSPLAQLVFIACMVIAKRGETDGEVTIRQVRREQPEIDDLTDLLEELVRGGLLSRNDGETYVIPGWFDFPQNKSRAELDELRARRVEVGRKGGQASGATKQLAKQLANQRTTDLVSKRAANVQAEKKNKGNRRRTEGESEGDEAATGADDDRLCVRDPELNARGISMVRDALKEATGPLLADRRSVTMSSR